jgi:hypothetical protein
MRVPLALSALAVATVLACSNGSNPDVTAPGVGTPIGGQPGDIAQRDAGTPGTPDGSIPDAGNPCNTQILPQGAVFATETCTTGVSNITNETIIPAGCNDVLIHGGVECHGALAGAANAFTGTCNALQCSSTKLPGIIFCDLPNQTQCTIQVCADVAGSNCP